MSWNQDTIGYRIGVIAGALEAVESVRLNLTPGDALELDDWLDDLANWTGGPMPPAPYKWPASS